MSSASDDKAVAVPWANLLPELCDFVLDRLDAISVLRFPAACSAWAAASKDTPRLRSGTPALLTAPVDPEGYDIEYNVDEGVFGLHDVATGKSFQGEAQGLKKRTWVGGKDDWLVTTDMKCGVELLNLVTGDRVPLPPFTTIPGLKVEELTEVRVAFNHQVSNLQQVALCRTPAHPKGFLAVALFSWDVLAITAAGDEGWTLLKNPVVLHSQEYTDTTFFNGKVFAVTTSGNIYSWDMDDAKATGPTLLPSPEELLTDPDFTRRFYLAVSASNDERLQAVCLYGYTDTDRRTMRIVSKPQRGFFHACRVSLHELDVAAGRWRRIRDLGGNRALFVGGNHPFYVDVPPGGSRDLQADWVYVADLNGCDAAAFNMKLADDEYCSQRPLDYPAMGNSQQMPMWFRPSVHPVFAKCQ